MEKSTAKKVISVGYPIGFCVLNGREYFNLELNGKTKPINLLSTYLWLGAISCVDKVTLMDNAKTSLLDKGFIINKHYTVDDMENMYQELVFNRCLVEIDFSDADKSFETLKEMLPLRQGFGLGVDSDSKIEVLNNGSKVVINPSEYYIWQLSNKELTVKEIYETFKELVLENSVNLDIDRAQVLKNTKNIFLLNFTNLYLKQLIYIVEF